MSRQGHSGDSILENLESIRQQFREAQIADHLCRAIAIRSLFASLMHDEESRQQQLGIHAEVKSMAGRAYPYFRDFGLSISVGGVDEVIDRLATELRPAIRDALFESTKLVRD